MVGPLATAGRLTRWQAGPERFEVYTYDSVGNRLELQNERGTVTYGYDAANRLLEELDTLATGGTTGTTYDWDPNGNLLSRQVEGGSLTNYTWDALNRLTSVEDASGSHTYGYDPNGIRVRETNGTETTLFLHAGEDILATYQNDAIDTYFTHGPGVDEPWAQARPGAIGFLVDIYYIYYSSDFSLPSDFPRAAVPIIFGLLAELTCTYAVFLYGIGTPFFL
jgi:YD repeat-containing protein